MLWHPVLYGVPDIHVHFWGSSGSYRLSDMSGIIPENRVFGYISTRNWKSIQELDRTAQIGKVIFTILHFPLKFLQYVFEGFAKKYPGHYVWFSQIWSHFLGTMHCLPQRLKSIFFGKKIEWSGNEGTSGVKKNFKKHWF